MPKFITVTETTNERLPDADGPIVITRQINPDSIAMIEPYLTMDAAPKTVLRLIGSALPIMCDQSQPEILQMIRDA